MHLGNKKTAPIFIKNFFNDFKAVLGRDNIIKDVKKCDFGPIRDHLNEQKMVKKAITDDERKQNKNLRQQTMFNYGFALVDGHLEKVRVFKLFSSYDAISSRHIELIYNVHYFLQIGWQL